MTANPQGGGRVLAYAALPMLVELNDDSEPIRATHLVGDVVSNHEQTPLVEIDTHEATGVDWFFSMIRTLGGCVVFKNIEETYVLSHGPEGFELVGAVVFADPEGESLYSFNDIVLNGSDLLVAASREEAVHVYDTPDFVGRCVNSSLRSARKSSR